MKIQGQSFKGVKRVVVPKQSMSLGEIVKRFIRRESLPSLKEGLYEERFGDLEKLTRKDITEKMEKVEELRKQIAEFNKRMKDIQAKDVAEKKRVEEERVQKLAEEKAKSLFPDKGNADQKSPPKGA